MRRGSSVLIVIAACIGAALLPGQVPTTQPSGNPKNSITRVVRVSLRGIALTDAEKTSLAAVSARYGPKFKAMGEAASPIRAALRAARQANDTAAAHTARRQLHAVRRDGITLLRSTLVDIRAALTAEHQTRFDKNVVQIRKAIRRRYVPST